MSNAITDCRYQSVTMKKYTTMINDSDIDSWKTESDSNESNESDQRIALVESRADYNRIREDVAKNSRSGPEIRYINPAIYTESVGEEEHDDVAQIHRPENDRYCNGHVIDTNHDDSEPSTIDLPSMKDATIEHATQNRTGRSTYRCYSTSSSDTTLFSEPFTVRSAGQSSRRTAQTERRCKISSVSANLGQNEETKQDKYRETRSNNRQVRISMTSLSTGPSVSEYQVSNGSDLGKRIGHSEWIRRKDEATQRRKEEEERAAKKRQEEEERIAREKEARAQLEKENFLKWVERKRQQELERKAILENELELQRRLKEIEDKAAVAKALYLRQWVQRKNEEQKTQHKEQEMRRRKMAEERERRLELSSKAYEKWRENSRNKPKPATQGLLPHQKAKPAYVNPIPWQSIVEINSDEAQEDAFNDKKGNINQLKMSGRKTIAAHQ